MYNEFKDDMTSLLKKYNIELDNLSMDTFIRGLANEFVNVVSCDTVEYKVDYIMKIIDFIRENIQHGSYKYKIPNGYFFEGRDRRRVTIIDAANYSNRMYEINIRMHLPCTVDGVEAEYYLIVTHKRRYLLDGKEDTRCGTEISILGQDRYRTVLNIFKKNSEDTFKVINVFSDIVDNILEDEFKDYFENLYVTDKLFKDTENVVKYFKSMR